MQEEQKLTNTQQLGRKQSLGVLLLRTLAFIMDASLMTVFTMFVLVRIVLPDQYSDALNAVGEAVHVYSIEVDEARKDDKPMPPPPELSNDQRVIEMFAYGQGLMIISLWLYFLISELALGGTTLGKKIFGLRTVSNLTGEGPPRTSQTILRSGIKAIALYGHPIFFIDYIIAFVTKGNRAGHDFLSRTRVVSKTFHSGTK